MAQPKKKTSKSKRDKRSANWKLTQPSLMECPQCHEAKMPHRAYPNCGYYDGREVVKVAEK